MKLHELQPAEGSHPTRRRIGRGLGSGRGTTAGKGTKGQKARAGGGVAPYFEGGQLPLVKRLPHRRGFFNQAKIIYQAVNLAALDRFAAGSEVGAAELKAAGLIRSASKPIVILGDGEFNLSLTVRAQRFSKAARERIEELAVRQRYPPLLSALLDAFRIPDLRAKLIFTGLMLVTCRFIAHVPVPGVNIAALERLFESNQFIGFLDLFSGGALSNFSIAAMGVYPYITASIIIQLMIPVIPQLTELSKEGESGRNKINQFTHLLTVPLAAAQAYGTPQLINASAPNGERFIENFGFDVDPLGTLSIIITMVAGTMILIWMGELITQYGIGNGVSMIIFGGIVASLPTMVLRPLVSGANVVGLLVFLVLGILTVAAIVLVYEGQRRIPVQVAKRIRGNRMYGGQSTHIPLKVNSAGMIPLIFASSILIFPGTVAGYFLTSENETIQTVARWVYEVFNVQTSWIYWVLYFWLVVAFTFFYTIVIYQQQNISENLQRQGGFIPGIRPGRPTAEYLYKVLTRITLVGALFLGIIAVLPFLVRTVTNVQALTLQSTALLIVVGVALDTMRQLEAQLLMRNYRGFINR